MARRNQAVQQVVIVGEAKEVAQTNIAPMHARPYISFDSWWSITENRLNLRPALKEAVQKHFAARGFLKNGDFDNGLVDFGIKT